MLSRRKGLLLPAAAFAAKARTLAYEQWDVFTDKPLTGNPLAVFLNARDLNTEEMQALARETNLSETTFILPRDAAAEKRDGVEVRIFTPIEELPFAGHPTLGTAAALQARMRESEVVLKLKAGRIPVRFRDGFGEMTQNDPEFGSMHSPDEIAALYGLTWADISEEAPIETVSTGLARPIVLLKSVPALERAVVQPEKLRAYLAARKQLRTPYLLARDGEGFRARNAGLVIEDPVTGSAGGTAIAWLVKHGIVASGRRVTIHQGWSVRRPGRMIVSAEKQGGRITDIRVAGQAVKIFEGTCRL